MEERRQALGDGVAKAYCLANLVLRNRDAPLPTLLEMRVGGMRCRLRLLVRPPRLPIRGA